LVFNFFFATKIIFTSIKYNENSRKVSGAEV